MATKPTVPKPVTEWSLWERGLNWVAAKKRAVETSWENESCLAATELLELAEDIAKQGTVVEKMPRKVA